MQLAFFLIPKAETVYLLNTYTMRQALEKMEYHKYTAVPVLDKEGFYRYTITAADFLWKLKNSPDLKFADTEKINIDDIPRSLSIAGVNINDSLQDLISQVVEHNFVPVLDDYGTYIGIIRRREIMEYMMPHFIKRTLNV